jgi:hypothetical protein
MQLRRAGQSYDQIATATGLSRTGVFDICKRHAAFGASALNDAPGGRKAGEGRTLTCRQEGLLRGLIAAHTPDELTMPQALWTRRAVGHLIEQRLGLQLPVRTLDSYLARWGFKPPPPPNRKGKAVSLVLNRWMIEHYPTVVAQSKAQGGEIYWGDHHEVVAEDAPAQDTALPCVAPVGPALGACGRLSMISSVTNTGQQRWDTFAGALDAPTLVDFVRRLITGTRKKVFLITHGMPVRHDRRVVQWLAEHEDDIQAFELPDDGPTHSPSGPIEGP